MANITGYTIRNLAIIYSVAFLVRAFVFGFALQHEQRYWQSDSEDYHFCARGINKDNFMVFREQPLFWRTPGFPLILAAFYKMFGATDSFADNQGAHKAFVWVQIALTSLIPVLLFFLALALTSQLAVAWIVAWLGVFHIGFVLASCYVLSDAIALIFFILFLLFLYRSCIFANESGHIPEKSLFFNAFLAGLYLALYTWIRPNGQFVSVVALLLLLMAKGSWLHKIKKVALFFGTFFLLIFPWCIRNHRLTGQWFYCSMSGPVLQTFTLPKVMRRVTGKDLKECFAYHMAKVNMAMANEWQLLQQHSPNLHLSRELVCKKVAMAHIFSHPLIFLHEWLKEVVKTSFDLYSSQIVYMLKKEHKWDPLEEVLLEKVALCLYGQPMPLWLRLIMWLEFVFSLVLWVGIFTGCWLFLVQPLYSRAATDTIVSKNGSLWLKVSFMIASLLVMTGGFGYARLRLPVDPLLIVLAVVFWYWLFVCKKDTVSKRNHS